MFRLLPWETQWLKIVSRCLVRFCCIESRPFLCISVFFPPYFLIFWGFLFVPTLQCLHLSNAIKRPGKIPWRRGKYFCRIFLSVPNLTARWTNLGQGRRHLSPTWQRCLRRQGNQLKSTNALKVHVPFGDIWWRLKEKNEFDESLTIDLNTLWSNPKDIDSTFLSAWACKAL